MNSLEQGYSVSKLCLGLIFFFNVATIFFSYMLFFFLIIKEKIIFSNYMANHSVLSGHAHHRMS